MGIFVLFDLWSETRLIKYEGIEAPALAARYRNAPGEFLYTGEEEKTPVTLIRIELHSLGLGVSISPLVALVSIEWHSLGLGS